ncbi:MAG: hypothetical protein H0T80_20580 [Betaproteobacteria bacterium]|nr:hypothetical protein [Betaproteobacteria bacterium]
MPGVTAAASDRRPSGHKQGGVAILACFSGSFVKELVEAHGGRVGAESAAGENRIWFTLPA